MNYLANPKFLNLEYWFNLAINAFVIFLGIIFDVAYWLERHSFKNLSIFLSIVFWVFILYVAVQFYKLKHDKKDSLIEVAKEVESTPIEERQGRWGEIRKHLSTEHQAEWKIAILEADTLLDDVLIKTGRSGENMGERLKGMNPADFASLQDVWDAHKIRNSIAHEPSYPLSKSQAEEAISKYERALRELKYL